MSGVAVVTGGAGGMGQVFARRLSEQGRAVLVTDIDAGGAERVAAGLPGDGAAMPLDVGKREDFEAALEKARELWGDPTILVNNAAVTKAADLMTLPAEDFVSVLGVNTSSAFLGCQVFGRAMADAGYGRIVNMASLAGQNGGTATGGHYAASKGAILTVTKIFARELASRGVTVNAISPGPHDLPVVHQTVPPDKLEGIINQIPVRHLGDPEFVADMVGLLTSDRASFVTGACWDVNGGLYVR